MTPDDAILTRIDAPRLAAIDRPIGFATDSDPGHALNEKSDLECFQKGIRSGAPILARIA
jgi:hypothetical protein